MKGVHPIVMPRDVAREKWKSYVKASEVHGEKYIKELKGLYYHLKEERKVIDIFEAFKFTGLNEKQEPKLAIAKADMRNVVFEKKENGSGKFKANKWQDEINLPAKTFPDFTKAVKKNTYDDNFVKERIKTIVPIVPADKLPKGKLSEFYILWEVKDWENVPVDPFLLKRISSNLFVIMASWNLTKLERALISGR